MVAIGDYQSIEQPVVNFGFIIMMSVYIIDFVHQAQQETKILLDITKKQESSSKNNNSAIEISQEIVVSILHKLKKFEDNEEYLKNKITVTALAKKFNTNTKYLSKTVNAYKKKNFTDYINELRVNYVLKRLNSDKQFRNYTLKAMANEVGFNTTDAFTHAFFKKESIKPSEYIKKLRKVKS